VAKKPPAQAMTKYLPDRLHVLGRRVGDQWVLTCLDFSLAAQDDSFAGAEKRLRDQISSYVQEALTWDKGAYAKELLSRKAPFWEWALFHAAPLLNTLHLAKDLFPQEQPCPVQTA
jgi:hypothetical protein